MFATPLSKDAALRIISTAVLLSLGQLVYGQDTEIIEEIIVWGRAIKLLGTADSASQGVVGYYDFSTRPLSRVAELVEVIPGMIATQHSGPGKANQYFLRGINLDHGSDFSNYFDGMPINFRSHAHAQGYLDLNFIIPEVIERIDYRKGPYYAAAGDFSLAGSSAFKTYDELEQGFSELSVGPDQEYRLVGADSLTLANGTLLYALEHEQTNSPFDLQQDVRKYNALLNTAVIWVQCQAASLLWPTTRAGIRPIRFPNVPSPAVKSVASVS